MSFKILNNKKNTLENVLKNNEEQIAVLENQMSALKNNVVAVKGALQILNELIVEFDNEMKNDAQLSIDDTSKNIKNYQKSKKKQIDDGTE